MVTGSIYCSFKLGRKLDKSITKRGMGRRTWIRIPLLLRYRRSSLNLINKKCNMNCITSTSYLNTVIEGYGLILNDWYLCNICHYKNLQTVYINKCNITNISQR